MSASSSAAHIVLLFCQNDENERQLAEHLQMHLVQKGHSVFLDRHPETSLRWAREIAHAIQSASIVIALLSEKSAEDEMLIYQIETAARLRNRPSFLAICLCKRSALHDSIEGILHSIVTIFLENPKDKDSMVQQVLSHLNLLDKKQNPLRIPRSPRMKIPLTLEAVGGAVPLGSEFYIRRPADKDLREAILRRDGIILIQGARQIGKTSLLARGLQLARERGAKVALCDFQKFNSDNLLNINTFYIALAESLSDQLELQSSLADQWEDRRSANVNFERFLRREVLGVLNAPFVWGLDEVDRLFTCQYASEVFGLFRSWHNERALDPAGLWAGFTLALTYATEAHLFITDMNQSPFNVGTRLVLEDFSKEQIAELNRRYGNPIQSNELDRLHNLVAGHPFLVRKSLHEIATHKKSLDTFIDEAACDEGLFGDHLRRILVLLAKDAHLTEVMRGVLRGEACPTSESFYRLRSSGIVVGNSQSELAPRCALYESFLKRHLLSIDV